MEYEKKNHGNMIFEYMVPPSYWIENTDSYCLQIDLPGFKKEEVRIRADNHGQVIVSGERQANDNKIIHFEQSFKVPETCDEEKTSAIFEDEVFYVTMPKKVTPEKGAPQLQNSTSAQEKDESQNNVNDDHDQNDEGTTEEEEDEDEDEDDEDKEEFHRTDSADESSESNLPENIKKDRSAVLTAILAFSLGIVLSLTVTSLIAQFE